MSPIGDKSRFFLAGAVHRLKRRGPETRVRTVRCPGIRALGCALPRRHILIRLLGGVRARGTVRAQTIIRTRARIFPAKSRTNHPVKRPDPAAAFGGRISRKFGLAFEIKILRAFSGVSARARPNNGLSPDNPDTARTLPGQLKRGPDSPDSPDTRCPGPVFGCPTPLQ